MRHILLECAPDDAQARAQAFTQAQILCERLVQFPGQFAELARKYSACPSKEQGGELGQISKGQTVPELERQLFTQGQGLVAKPLESRYGWHVLSVDQRIEGQPLPYEAVATAIRTQLQQGCGRRRWCSTCRPWWAPRTSAGSACRVPIRRWCNRSRSMGKLMQDGFGRQIDYLRLSVTDRCDLRCVYCMASDMTFLPRQQVLTLEELLRLATLFVGQGVRKIRLTGGEPLVRPGIVELCRQIAALPGLRELVMTTNGTQLQRLARPLADAGVRRLNISLDSLDGQRFRAITRNGDLDQVLRGIEAARQAGFEGIKLNCVVMQGRNFDEVPALLQYAIDQGIDITFIEEMPLGRWGARGARRSVPATRCGD